MTSPDVNPLDPLVLERNYDYAQKNVWILSMWYNCEVEQMLELLIEHNIELSENDKIIMKRNKYDSITHPLSVPRPD